MNIEQEINRVSNEIIAIVNNIEQEINRVSNEIIAIVNNIEQEKNCIMVLDNYVETLKSMNAYNEKYGLNDEYDAELEKFLNEILC